MGLKFFKRGNYTGVTEALTLIRQEFESLWSKVDNQRRPEESSVAEQQSYVPQISTGSTSYNGYFTIKLTENVDDSIWLIEVVDGATYDEIQHTSGKSPCMVNNTQYAVDYASVALTSVQWLYVIIEFKRTYIGETGHTSPECNILFETTLDLSGTIDRARYLVGRIIPVTYAGSVSMVVDQTHTTGVPQLLWFSDCVPIESEVYHA